MVLPVVLGIVIGLLGRVLYLRPGSADFPTRPHGTIIHLFLGFVASVLGSLAVAAIAKGNLTAGVFLGLGTAQFHTLRGIEREYLSTLDKDEIVPRGAGYVEGLASAFEARDFLVFITALVTTLVTMISNPGLGVLAGLAWIAASQPLVRGKVLQNIAVTERVPFEIREGVLEIDGVDVHRVEEGDETTLRDGWAAAIKAKSFSAWLTLENHGQRQAIRHDFTARFGCTGGTAPFWPLVVPDKTRRRLLFFSIAEAGDPKEWLDSFSQYTVLETSYRSSRATPRKRRTPEVRPSLQ